MKGANQYLYTETLPSTKKIYAWTLEEPGQNQVKNFTTKLVTISPKRNAVIIPQPMKQLEKTPMHIDDDLADLVWLPEALYPDNKQDKQDKHSNIELHPNPRVDYHRPARKP